MGLPTLIILGATYLIAAPCVAIAAYMYRAGMRVAVHIAARIIIALPVAYILGRIAGLFYSHEQPFAVYGFEPLVPHDIDNSFPSDHTSISAALAGAMWFTNKTAGTILLAFPLLIGASRIAAGLHYPVDVAAGLAIGLCASGIAYAAERAALARMR